MNREGRTFQVRHSKATAFGSGNLLSMLFIFISEIIM
jgi:hypothetical protein